MTWAQPLARATSAFSSVRDRADHGDAERARVAGDEPDAARRRHDRKDRLAALERIDLPEQVLRGHALHHQRRRGQIPDAIRDRDQHVGRHHPDIGIGALRPEQIADAVARADVGDPGADRLDDAHGIGAEPARQRHRIAAGPEIDVDEVDRDIGVAHARLPGSGSPTSTGTSRRTSGPPVSWMRMAWDMVSSLSAPLRTVRRPPGLRFRVPKDQALGHRPFAEARGRVEMADRAEVDETGAPAAREFRDAAEGAERIVLAGGDDARERQPFARDRQPASRPRARGHGRIAFRHRPLEIGGVASSAPSTGSSRS